MKNYIKVLIVLLAISFLGFTVGGLVKTLKVTEKLITPTAQSNVEAVNLQQLIDSVAVVGSPTLQNVTDNGATTNDIINIPNIQFTNALFDANSILYLTSPLKTLATSPLSVDGSDVVNSGGFTSEWVDYTNQASQPYQEGLLYFDATKNNLVFYDSNSEVALDIGKEQWIDAINVTGLTITDGQVVFIDTVSSNTPTIELANSDLSTTASGVIGMATHNIEDGTIGRVTTFGIVRDINTLGMTAGKIAYLSTTDGGFQDSRPEYPMYAIQIGQILIEDAVNGQVFINVIGRIEDILDNGWNGNLIESFDFRTTVNNGIIKGYLVRSDADDFLTMNFSDGFTLLDVSPADTISLTAGTDPLPQINYVYIPKSTKVLTTTTGGFPSTEHIRIAVLNLRSVATTLTEGALGNQNWNDHVAGSQGARGHILHISDWIRLNPAKYISGAKGSINVVGASSPDDVYFSTTGGIISQMHPQDWDATEMPTDDIHVFNDPVTAWQTITNLNSELTDASGGSLSGRSWSFVFWGIQNKTGEISHTVVNLPTDSYSGSTDAINDPSNFSVYTIPQEYQSKSFLIARATFSHSPASGGTWTLDAIQDLTTSNILGGGGGGGGGGVSTLLELIDMPSSYSGFSEAFMRVASGETAGEFVLGSSIDVGIFNDDGTYKLDFSENTAFNLNFGTLIGTVAQGNDSRILNGQTAFGWGNWAVGVDKAFVDALGINATQLNSQNPSFYLDRTNHTGTQTASTISDFQTTVSANTDVSNNTLARHNAITIGTANGLTLSTQELSLGLSSTSTIGALSNTDWNTFNNKQDLLTNPITGSGSSGFIPKWNSTSTLNNSIVQDNGLQLFVAGFVNADYFESDIATGTAPIQVASTTLNTNLNAEFLGGFNASSFQIQIDAKADTADVALLATKNTFTESITMDSTLTLTPNITSGRVLNLPAEMTLDYETTIDSTYGFSLQPTGVNVFFKQSLEGGQNQTYYFGDGVDNFNIWGISVSDDLSYTWLPAIVVSQNGRVGVNKNNPDYELDVNGISGADNFISSVATGTQPYATTSTTLNINLNADLLDGNEASAFQTSLTFGIANTNAVQINSASVISGDFARFTASGLEGRSNAEVLSDIGAASASLYVPYSGATTDLNLGSNHIISGHGASFTSINNSTYGVVMTGTVGGARNILLVGQAGFSNGFTIGYDGANMVYSMANGALDIGGLLTASALKATNMTSSFFQYYNGTSLVNSVMSQSAGDIDINGDLDVNGDITANNLPEGGGISYATALLDATAVGNLGSAQTLIAAPGAGKAIMLIDIFMELNVATTLEVGTQNLQVYVGNSGYNFANSNVESATDLLMGATKFNQDPTLINTALTVALSSTVNPSSGSATMTFHITYKVIDVNI